MSSSRQDVTVLRLSFVTMSVQIQYRGEQSARIGMIRRKRYGAAQRIDCGFKLARIELHAPKSIPTIGHFRPIDTGLLHRCQRQHRIMRKLIRASQSEMNQRITRLQLARSRQQRNGLAVAALGNQHNAGMAENLRMTRSMLNHRGHNGYGLGDLAEIDQLRDGGDLLRYS